METIEYIRQRVHTNERRFTVWRSDDERSYDSTLTEVGTVPIWAFDATATSGVVTEGVEEETSITGYIRPSADLPDSLSISDEVRVADHPELRYEVRTKVGVPSALDPLLYRLGLERANDSTSP